MENLELYDKKLVESLKLLALPYMQQKQCFENFVDVPFEVLDTFDNAFFLLPGLIEANKYTNVQIAAIIRLHNLINFTSSNLELKDLDEDQFSSNKEWNKIRELSKEILCLMGEVQEKPDLKYI